MKSKTHTKLNITLPIEVHQWCVKKQEEEQRKTKFGKVALSKIIAQAVQDMKTIDESGQFQMSEIRQNNPAHDAQPSSPSLNHRKIKGKFSL
jgi:hypothetical protein